MRVAQGSKLVFSTTSNDCSAIVAGPDAGDAPAAAGKALPTGTVGFYTLSVTDRQLRKYTVTLTGTAPFATPLTTSREGIHVVLVPYEVF